MSSPRLFDEVIGHRRVMRLLADELQSPAHAYLFVGPAGVGKATVARWFATALLCPEAGAHDDLCSSCRRAVGGNHPDLSAIEPEGSSALTVDQIRSIVGKASFAPIESERKVFLISEAGSMTDAAANSFLKTLEEPTPGTIFLLAAESEDDFPATVASRCRTVQFGRVDEDAIVAAIAANGVEEATAIEVARIAGGRPGLALALARQPEVAAFRRLWLGLPMRFSASPGIAFRLAEEVIAAIEPLTKGLRERHAAEPTDTKAATERQGREVKRASQNLLVSGLEILASFYTDSASAQLGGPVRNPDIPAPVLAQTLPPDAVRSADRMLEAVVDLRRNLRPSLVLANLFVDLAPG